MAIMPRLNTQSFVSTEDDICYIVIATVYCMFPDTIVPIQPVRQ